MELKDGDVILVHANSFSTWYRWLFSHLIRLLDGVFYNHGQIVSSGLIYEADTKVRTVDVSTLDGDNILVLRPKVPLTEEETTWLSSFLELELGRPYGYFAVLVWQLLYILTSRRIWLGFKGGDADRKPYCTELVSRAYNKMRGYYPTYYKTAPSELLSNGAFYFDVVFEGIYKK